MKLTIEQLAIYLPYKPEFDWNGAIYVIDFNHKHIRCHKGAMSIQTANMLIEKGAIKSIMHPLSDLTEKITVKGYNDDKPFVPIIEMVRVCHRTDDVGELIWLEKSGSRSYRKEYRVVLKGQGIECKLYWDIFVFTEGMRFDYIQLLAKWHFWIYDQKAFKEGTIIDINTLK